MTKLDCSICSRRTFIRAGAAGAGTIVLGAGTTQTNFSPIGRTQAIPLAPIGAGFGVIGAAAAVGWALREFEWIGSDDPPDGITEEALLDRAKNALRTRQSTELSTFIDNRNILEGIEDSVYADAKIEAIERLNDGESQSDVQDAATAVVDNRFAVIEENLINSWNEMIEELDFFQQAFIDHPDIDDPDEHFNGNPIFLPGSTHLDTMVGFAHREYQLSTETNINLVDGSTKNVKERATDNGNDNPFGTDSFEAGGPLSFILEHRGDSVYIGEDEDEAGTGGIFYEVDDWKKAWLEPQNIPFEYIPVATPYAWRNLHQELLDAHTTVNDGIITWVDTVYSQVQQGELEVEELLTPREHADLVAEDEDTPHALADLIALNQSVNPNVTATVTLEDYDVNLQGIVATTTDTTLETGETYNPDIDNLGTVFLSYDLSLAEGDWQEYDESIDGGEVTFFAEPFEGHIYQIETIEGEIVDVPAANFNEDNGDWTVDIGSELDDPITQIEEVKYYSDVEESTFQTIQIDGDFTIEEMTDSDGSELDSADYEQGYEPQSDDNYLTQEEWDDMNENMEQLIEDYEDSQSGGGGGLLPDLGGTGGIAALVAIAAGFIILLQND